MSWGTILMIDPRLNGSLFLIKSLVSQRPIKNFSIIAGRCTSARPIIESLTNLFVVSTFDLNFIKHWVGKEG